MFGYSLVRTRELSHLHRKVFRLTGRVSVLQAAVAGTLLKRPRKELPMPADLQPLIDEITRANTVIDGAVLYIKGIPALIQAKIDEALANGATAAQLAPLTDLGVELKVKADALEAALKEGTGPDVESN